MSSSQILVHFMYIAEKVKESAIKEREVLAQTDYLYKNYPSLAPFFYSLLDSRKILSAVGISDFLK